MVASEEVLRRLTIADPAYLRTLAGPRRADRALSTLDRRAKRGACSSSAALVATEPPSPIWQQCVGAGAQRRH